MFPEVGASELVVIGIVALLVVGPKDLPVLLRKVGQWMSKIRGLAAEFKSSFSEMARQSELDDLRKEVEALRSGVQYDTLSGSLGNELQSNFDQIKSSLNDVPAGGLHDWEVGRLADHPDEPEAVADAAEAAPAAKPKRVAKPKAAAAPAAKKPAAKKTPAKPALDAAKKPAPPRKPAAAKKTPAKKAKA
jgi:sec-independent protein translocase protein TatB